MLDALADTLPAVHEHLDAARADVLAFASFPKEIWRQIWSNNPIVILSPGCGGLDLRQFRGVDVSVTRRSRPAWSGARRCRSLSKSVVRPAGAVGSEGLGELAA
jgi:hypothetical protein